MIEYEKHGLKPFEYITEVIDYREERNKFVFNCTTDRGRNLFVQVHVLTNGIVRVISGTCGEIPTYENDLVVNRSFEDKELECSVDKSDKLIKIRTTCLLVEISLNPWNITFNDSKGKTVLAESANDVNPVDKLRARPLGVTYEEESSKIVACNESFIMKQGEHYYGFGEKFTELDKRGQKIVAWNRDALGVRNEAAYKNIPFFMSTSGYGLFVNSSEAVEFDVGSFSNSSLTIGAPGECLDYYFIYGPDFKDILYWYTQITGKAPVPPLWSFGLWMSTGFFGADRSSVEECADKVRGKGIPCDVMHFDCFWLRDNMWCDFEWDRNNYPNTEEMIQNLKDKGYKVCLWLNPYVSQRSEMFNEGSKKGYFLKTEDGEVYVRDMWHGLYPSCGIIDFTNPEAVEWFKEKLRKLLKMDIDVFKTDFGEDIPVDAHFYNGKTGIEMHNLYSLIYNQAVFEVTGEFKDNPMVWGRSGFAGSQRYPVCWSGDPACTYEAMAAVLRGGLSYGMSGVPFWSHDIGGFYGSPSKELYIRWAQFGLFSSHSRCHGTTSREPWFFGEEAEEIFKKYVELRYRLLPYIYSTALQCSKTGLPFIRPLVLMNQDDPTTYHIDDEYYFGDSILVAPVFSDESRRMVYLPEGEWIDYWKREVYCGRQWIEYETPLDTLPLFVKKGSIIPVLKNEIKYIDRNVFDKGIELEVYDDRSTSGEIYTDKGKANLRVQVSKDGVKLLGLDSEESYLVSMKL